MNYSAEEKEFNPEDYDMTYEYGFLLQKPLTGMSEYFKPWNTLVERFPDLIKNKTVRDAVDELPLLDHKLLSSHQEKRFAHMVLSLVTAGYVKQEGDTGVTTILPKQIAVPLCGVSDELGIQPIVSHASLVLANWKMKDPSGPLDLRNVEPIMTFHPPQACNWFLMVTWLVEYRFAPAVKLIENIRKSIADSNTAALIVLVTQLTEIIQGMLAALKRMDENLTPEQFYNGIRPYLSGWGGSGSALPDGLIYEDVQSKPIKLAGGSAAQSTAVQALDAVLGITHSHEQAQFLMDMRRYMPSGHRKYIEDLCKRSSLKQYVEKQKDESLIKTYNAAVAALKEFRSYHIQIVTRYIVIVARSQRNEHESIADQGTGGTSILPFLKSVRDTTEEHRIMP